MWRIPPTPTPDRTYRKRCSRCGELKRWDQFPRADKHSYPDGLLSYCKLCKQIFRAPRSTLYDIQRTLDGRFKIAEHPTHPLAPKPAQPKPKARTLAERLTLRELGNLADAIAAILPELLPLGPQEED